MDERLLLGAAKTGNVGLARVLARDGVNTVAQNDDGDTALHIAARSGDYEFVLALVNPYAAKIKNKVGETPLDLLPFCC